MENNKICKDRVSEALLDSIQSVPDYPIEAIVVGSHLLGIKSRQVGLSSLVDTEGGHLRSIPHEKRWKSLKSESAKKVARKIIEFDTFDAGLGLAAITSLYDYSKMSFINVKAQDIIVEKGEGKEVAVVGHFPFVSRIRDKFKKLWVIELKPREGDIGVEEGYRVLPRCELVAITGSTIINKTLSKILMHCNRRSYKILMGPSTPMTNVLFEFGIDLLAGSRVVKEEAVFEGIFRGKPFRYLDGIEMISLERK